MKKSVVFFLALALALPLALLSGCGAKRTDGPDAASTGGEKGEVMDLFLRDGDAPADGRGDAEYAEEEDSDENVIYVEDEEDEEDGALLLEFENFTGGVIFEEDDGYFEVEQMRSADQGIELTYNVWAERKYSGDAWYLLAVNGLWMNDELFQGDVDGEAVRGFVYTGKNRTATLTLDWETLAYMGVKDVQSIELNVRLGYVAYGSSTLDTEFTAVLYPGAKVSTEPVMPEPANPDWVLADKEGERLQITGARLYRGGADNSIQGVMLYYAMEGTPGNTSVIYVHPPQIGEWVGKNVGRFDNTSFFFDTTNRKADIVTGCCLYTGNNDLLDQNGSFDNVVLPYTYNEEDLAVTLDLGDTK